MSAPDAAAGAGASEEESLPGQVVGGGDASGGTQGLARGQHDKEETSSWTEELDAYSIESVKQKHSFEEVGGKRRFLLPPLPRDSCPGTKASPATSSSQLGLSASDRENSVVATRDASMLSPPTRDMSRTSGCSRRSFLEKSNSEALQRLAAAGVRSSVMSDLTDEKIAGGRCARCWFRFRCLRFQTWLFLEEPFLSVPSCMMSSIMVLTILASICDSVWTRRKSSKPSASVEDASVWADRAFNVVFSVEFAVRLWAFPLRCRFFQDPKNAIDVVSVLPFFVNDVLGLPVRFSSLSFLHWLSTYEAFLRLLKLSRYFWGWQLLFRAVHDSAKALVIPLFFLLLIVILGSCTLYIFEMSLQEAQEGHDDDGGIPKIGSLPDAMHFSILCVLSMSTGPFYGKQANSFGGRSTVIFLMVFGMLFMAMPIAIVGSCFSETWFDQDRIVLLEKVRSCLLAQGYTSQNISEVFDEVDEDGSGELEFNEFKKMIKTFHLRSLNIAKCRRLFHYFDTDGDGVINFTDFALTLYPDLPLEGDQEYENDNDLAGEPPTPFPKLHRRNSVHSCQSTVSRIKKLSDNPGTGTSSLGPGTGSDSTDMAVQSCTSMKSPRRTGSSKKSSLSIASRSSNFSQKSMAAALRDGLNFIFPRSDTKPELHAGAASSSADDTETPKEDDLPMPASPVPSVGLVIKDDSFAESHGASMVIHEAASIADVRSAASRCSNFSWHSSCFSDATMWNRDPTCSQGATMSRLEQTIHRMERRVERRLDQLNSFMVRQASSRPSSGLGFLMGFGEASKVNKLNRSLPGSSTQSRRQSHQSQASTNFPNLLAPPKPRTGKMRQHAATGASSTNSKAERSRSPSPSDDVSVPGSQNS